MIMGEMKGRWNQMEIWSVKRVGIRGTEPKGEQGQKWVGVELKGEYGERDWR